MESSDSTKQDIIYRQGTRDDMRAVQTVFLNSLYDLLFRYSMSDHNKPTAEETQQNWDNRKTLYEYLTTHAEQYWLAEQDGKLLGYARSVKEDGLRELTELFVSPDTQSRGIGKALLERAFPSDDETINCIIATGDVRAHARYLKSGVHSQFLMYTLHREPVAQTLSPQLTPEQLNADDRSVALLAEIDKVVLGHRRDHQHRWLLAERPCFIYRVDGEIIGYGYVGENGSGPFALYNPKWFPMVFAHAENETLRSGRERIYLTIPTPNRIALQYCLDRGYKIDEFLMYFLSSKAFGQFDRYIGTDPAFVL